MVFARWIAALAILAFLVIVSWYALHVPPQLVVQGTGPSSPSSWQDYVTPSPPAWVPHDWLDSPLRDARLPPIPPTDVALLTQGLTVLANQLRLCPFIAQVSSPTSSDMRLRVRWVQAVPVILVPDNPNTTPDIWLAGENSLWLIKCSHHLPPDLTNSLPVKTYSRYFHSPQPASPLPDSLMRAVRLVLALQPYGQSLALDSVWVGYDPVVLDIQLLTRGGSRVLWESFDKPLTDSATDSEKLSRLLEYVRRWRSLDEPAGPYFFDNRFPNTLLRRPLKP